MEFRRKIYLKVMREMGVRQRQQKRATFIKCWSFVRHFPKCFRCANSFNPPCNLRSDCGLVIATPHHIERKASRAQRGQAAKVGYRAGRQS